MGAIVCAALVSCVCARAQIDVGGVSGTVKDPSGAVVPNAQLRLTNNATNVSQTTVSGSTGAYAFGSVPPGNYTLKVTAPNFKETILGNITVYVQQTNTVDVTLQLGVISQQIKVTSAQPLLQAQDASVGQTADTQTINDLPLNGRNWMSLTELAAGSYTNANSNPDATGTFLVDGAESGQVDARLNGVDDNLEIYGGFNIAPIPDAIEEFRLQAGDNSAELGHSTGAVINAVTKSGTNHFHGDVFNYFRNEFLNANDYFNNLHHVRRTEYRQNQVGGTIGGPVLLPGYNGRDRTFFFFDWQATPHASGGNFTETVPTANMRNSGFSNLQDLISGNSGKNTDALGRTFSHGTVLDPATTRFIPAGGIDSITGLSCNPACPSGAYVRDPFYTGSLAGRRDFTQDAAGVPITALNHIPSNRLDPNTIAVLNLLPPPNVANAILTNNYFTTYLQHYIDNQFDLRVDQTINDKNSFFATISHQFGNNGSAQPFPGIAGGALSIQFQNNHSYWESTASYTHIFSPTMSNEVRFGWDQNYYDNSLPTANMLGLPAQFGIPGIPQIANNGGLPTFNYNGFSSFGGRRFTPTIQTTGAYDVSDNVTKVVRGHEIKAGVQYLRAYANIIQPSYSKGQFSYSGQFSDIPNKNSNLLGISDWLLMPTASTVPLTPGVSNFLGGVSNTSAGNGYNLANYAGTDYEAPYVGVYVQDTWKVTPRLTLIGGLRWDRFWQFAETSGRQANMIMTNGNGPSGTLYLAHDGCNEPRSPGFNTLLATDNISVVCRSDNTVTNAQNTNFAPRVGFAYRVLPNLVMRAGFGIAYGAFDSVGYGGTLGTNYPFQYTLNSPTSTSQSPLTNPAGQTVTMENAFADTNIQDPLSINGVNLGLTGKQFNYQTPYDESMNFTVQYQFTGHDSIQAGYVGTLGRHLDTLGTHNATTVMLPPSVNAQPFLPMPQFSTSEFLSSNAISSYHSLQVVFQHQFDNGLNILGNYTFAKCLSNDVGKTGLGQGSGFRAEWLPGFGIRPDYTLCGTDATHLAHVSGQYALPIGNGHRFAPHMSGPVNAVAGGWQVNFIYTFQSGQPVNIGCPVATTSNFGCFAFLAPGVDPYAGPNNRTQWLNPAAFIQPPVATTPGQTDFTPLGTRASQVRGPGFYNVDLSIMKRFDIWEHTRLEFRAEAFNAFNNVQYANPSQLNFTTSNFSNITSDRFNNGAGRIGQLVAKWLF